MNYMPSGSYVEGNSLIHRMDAFLKLLCTFLLLASVIFSDSAAGYLLILSILAILIRVAGLGVGNALGGVRHMWMFFLVIFCMNAVFFDTEQPLFSWWIFQPSMEGVIQGLQVVLRVALAMVLGNILMATTSPLEVMSGLERLIFPLKYIGVPVRDVAMILGVSMQFIPTFVEDMNMIMKAQTARGARFESRNLKEKAESVLPLVIPIFLSAFRRADELSVAMEARGYRRSKKKVKWQNFSFQAADVMLFLLSGVLCVAETII